jgi:hypothetical protein
MRRIDSSDGSRRRKAADWMDSANRVDQFRRLTPAATGWGRCRWSGEHAGWAVAQRRRDGSRGLQPTVAGEPNCIARRGATPETGEGCIQASLRDASGWAAPEPWVKAHGYLRGTAPRRLQADDLPSPAADPPGSNGSIPPTVAAAVRRRTGWTRRIGWTNSADSRRRLPIFRRLTSAATGGQSGNPVAAAVRRRTGRPWRSLSRPPCWPSQSI